MINPIHERLYPSELTVNIIDSTDMFKSLFEQFYKQKVDIIMHDVKFFRVNELTLEELNSLKDKFPYINELIDEHDVEDFIIINDILLTDISDYIDDNGYTIINLSDFDLEGEGFYQFFNFKLSINFNKPIKDANWEFI